MNETRSIVIFLLMFFMGYLFTEVLPEQLIDGVPSTEIGWKSSSGYYLFPVIFLMVIIVKLVKYFFINSYYTVTIGMIADTETGDKDATIIYEHNGEQYACVYKNSRRIKPDWPIKVHVHPKNHNQAVFDLWMRTKATLVGCIIAIILVLVVGYYSQ